LIENEGLLSHPEIFKPEPIKEYLSNPLNRFALGYEASSPMLETQ